MKSRTAVKTVETLMSRFNKNPQSLVFSRLADEYRKDGNYSKAIEICINGLQANPDYVTGRIILGLCYIEQGNHQAAIQELLAAISLDRRNQNAMKMLADLFNRQGNKGTSGDLYNLLNRSDPGNKSLQIISKQFTFSGNTDIYSILGLPSPQTSFNFKAKEQQEYTPDIDKTNIEQPSFHDAQTMALSDDALDVQFKMEDSTSQVTSEDVGSRMNEMFGSDDSISTVQSAGDQEIIQSLDSPQSLSGEDIADRMNALFNSDQPQETVETLGSNDADLVTGDDISMQLGSFDIVDKLQGTPDLSIEQPMLDDSLQTSNELSGNEVSDHIESLFGDDTINPPDVTSGLSLDLPQNESSGLLSGDDLQDHLDLLMPSDTPESTFTTPQTLDDSFIETSLSKPNMLIDDNQDSLSGNDFAEHLDSLTGDSDKLLLNTDTTDDLEEDLLSTKQSELIDEGLSGDDFASHMDSLLSSDDVTPELQGNNEFSNIIDLDNNGQSLLDDSNTDEIENLSSAFDQDMAPEMQTSDLVNDNGLLLDALVTDDTSMPLDNDESIIEDLNDNTGFSVDNNQQSDTLTGNDFTNHLDMIFGSDAQSDQSIYSRISNDYDSVENVSPVQENVDNDSVTGDDIGNRIDLLSGDFSGTASVVDIKEDEQGGFSIDTSEESINLMDNQVSGNDIADKLDMLSGEMSGESTIDTSGITIQNDSVQHEDLLEISNDQVSGDDVSDRLGALENEPFLTIDQPENVNDLQNNSPFVNTEFEETMQIDRSFIENVKSLSEPDQDTPVDQVDNSTHMVNPFEFENETIQIDRSDLFGHQSREPDTTDESLILNVDNPSPNLDSQFTSEDIHVDHDEQTISEMDVLVAPTKDIQGVTGDDVIDKIDTLFSDEKPVEQEQEITDMLGPDTTFTDDNEEELPLSPDGFTSEMYSEPVASVPQVDDSITGNDVEQRMDEFFSGVSGESKDVQNYQEAAEELEIEDSDANQNQFFMTELENGIDNSQDQNAFTDNTYQQTAYNQDVKTDFSSQVFNSQDSSQNAGLTLNPIDERDKPYSIPDHVLTPTLADIYYQQGQYQLALQIYTRLIEKDPDNVNLQERYEEIQAQLDSQANQPGQFYDFGKDTQETDIQKGKKKTPEVDKPLSGVRIKKNKKPKK